MNVSRYIDTVELKFDVEFVTPCFLGGADGNADIRVAPFKNLLRRWWRIANGHLSPEELWKKESRLFGSTEKDPDIVEENKKLPKEKRKPETFGKSKVELKLLEISPNDNYTCSEKIFIGKNEKTDLALYTGYGSVNMGKTYIKNQTNCSFILSCPTKNEFEFEKKIREYLQKKKIKEEQKKLNNEKNIENEQKKREEEIKKREEKIKEISKRNEFNLRKKILNYNAKQEKILKLQEEQEEKKKKEQEEILLRLKEKNEKNLEKKKKNAEMVEQRRQKILDKYLETEQRIKKQKDENNKELFNKYLTIAMKREDTMNNLERFERMQEFEREKKITKLLNREKRLNDLQKKKNEINIKKKDLNQQLSNRKKELIGKANSILLSGDYENVNEIFKKLSILHWKR